MVNWLCCTYYFCARLQLKLKQFTHNATFCFRLNKHVMLLVTCLFIRLRIWGNIHFLYSGIRKGNRSLTQNDMFGSTPAPGKARFGSAPATNANHMFWAVHLHKYKPVETADSRFTSDLKFSTLPATIPAPEGEWLPSWVRLESM